MKVLFVSTEVEPFSKSGGLADVAFALPKALKEKGVDVRIMTPKNFYFKPIYETVQDEHLFSTEVQVGWRNQFLGVSQASHEGIPYYFLDSEQYFKRSELYGYEDDGERFSYFCNAVLTAVAHKEFDFEPDVIHINDWHTGMIPLLIKQNYQHVEKLRDVKTVFTIHNLKFQGIYDKSVLGDMLNLSMAEFHSGRVRWNDDMISFMKAAIHFSDHVTTVSETYAEEIMTEEFGEHLDNDLRNYAEKVSGIVNGIDTSAYNPEDDEYISAKYSAQRSVDKRMNKLFLQEYMGLLPKESVPLFGMITRLTDQKGLDIMASILDRLLEKDIQIIVLGTGDEKYENMLRDYEYRYGMKFSAMVGFNNTLAHRIYAGSDMFLMPSRFEPCGLSQIISQRYGTLPIVRGTGGLEDTVKHYDLETGEGSGFVFGGYDPEHFLRTIEFAISIFENKREWRRLLKQVMKIDSSWNNSSEKYLNLYEELTK